MDNTSKTPDFLKLEQQTDAKKYILAQKLGTRKGFFLFYFDQLPKFNTQTDCFNAVNMLHYEIFGEEKYSSYDSFRRRVLEILKK